MKRKLNRLIFHFLKMILILLSYLSHRLYMRFYVPLLKFNGMNINGMPRYIGPFVKFDDFDQIHLGNRNVISDECHFLTHDYSLTTALISINEKPDTDRAIIKSIKLGNNCFIGKKSILMPGTLIGNNVIVGAGAVVRGIIPDGSVVIGNPAKVITKTETLAQKWKYNDINYREDK